MKVPAPHFLLFSESNQPSNGDASSYGQWRFVLESVDGQSKLEAADDEPQVHGERLDLLAVVRGLEALDQPSRVTLVTSSRYVSRGLRNSLTAWRENDWQWERFGEMTPVKNGDLWRRVDRALQFHDVDCRTWRFDPPQNILQKSRAAASTEKPAALDETRKPAPPRRLLERLVRGCKALGGPRRGWRHREPAPAGSLRPHHQPAQSRRQRGNGCS